MKGLLAAIVVVLVLGCAVVMLPLQSAPAQVDTENSEVSEFHQAAFLAALSDTSSWLDSDFGQAYLALMQQEGFTTEQMQTFLSTFPPWMAKQVADASVPCYYDGECEWNIRGPDWPMENPDNWYTNTMADTEVWCKHWPDHIPMWEDVFWTCLQVGGTTAASTCRTMIESNRNDMDTNMWVQCVPHIGW